MNKSNIRKVRDLCIEVRELCGDVTRELGEDHCYIIGTPKSAELRRRSMDLTRALADMRKAN